VRQDAFASASMLDDANFKQLLQPVSQVLGHRLLVIFWILIIQRIRNADINRTTQWIINKKGTFDEKRYTSCMMNFLIIVGIGASSSENSTSAVAVAGGAGLCT
jgi:hypothetical protein